MALAQESTELLSWNVAGGRRALTAESGEAFPRLF